MDRDYFHDEADGVELFEDAIKRERAAIASERRRQREAREIAVDEAERDEVMHEAWDATQPEEEMMTEATADAPAQVENGTGLIHKAIAAIMGELGPIAKGQRNQQQGYSFRGIDDVYNALHPLMAKNRVYCLPEVLDREVQERTTQRGGTLLYTRLSVRFELICAEDASSVSGTVEGEAMDSGDKSSNKAMSAAMKYFYLIVFAIPTADDNDADATTPPASQPRTPAQQKLGEEAGNAFDKHDAVGAPSLVELLELCDRFGLKDVQKAAWCKHFKVERIEDLAEESVKAIIVKVKRLHAQNN